MEISLALILDELGLESVAYIPEGVNPKFRSVELYAIGETQFSRDKLLVCPLSEAIAAVKRDGMFFLCIRDRNIDEQENDRTMSGISVVSANIGLRELFNRVQRVFVKVTEWVMAMESGAAKRRGLQDLIDLAEPVFRNFITVQDSTFKLIAYTKNIEPTSLIMSRLVEHGYHPPETMELFRQHRRLEEFKKSSDVIVSRDNITSGFDVVKKTFHLGGSIFIMIVMDCSGRAAGSAVVELFGILTEYIRAYADYDTALTGGLGGVKALALDILNRTAGSKEDARIRASYCGYPFEGGFRLYVFSFEDDDNVPTAHLVSLLSEACPDAASFSRGRHVLLLEHEREDTAQTKKSAETSLNAIGFQCGISNDFECLWDLPAAFEQAIIAADVPSRLNPSVRDMRQARFHPFSDDLIYHIVSTCFRAAPGVFENSFLTRSLAIMREHDDHYHTETLRILRLFLENERSATVTASIMHMHRNTVLYHIEKISRLLGLSLDDPDTRLQLLLAFRADDFSELS